MNLTARLLALERKQPPPPPDPIDAAQAAAWIRLLCVSYAQDGPDGLRHALTRNPQLSPGTVDQLMRLVRTLVERTQHGEPLTAYQAMILEGIGEG